MSKRSDRVSELSIQVAVAILLEAEIDDWDSFQTLKASYDLRSQEEHSRISMLRSLTWKALWKFTDSESPGNLNSLIDQIDKLRVIK